ncbi:MAG: GSCFA domain-containing protein, partial [Planctomycetes bacterium]|nr:GSCFA domain-containing protein [Planctomycetota bacterium]
MSQIPLTTPVEFSDAAQQMSHRDSFMNLGSCFASAVQNKMYDHKCFSAANPLGIIFNPASIARTLDLLLSHESLDRHRQCQDLYVNCDAHGDFSCSSEDELDARLQESLADGLKQWHAARHIIMTLGTSFIYELRETGKVVANCHRLPATDFQRRQLSIDEIVDLLSAHIEAAPDKNFYLTVSPVRHKRDGLVENTQSKAMLILAVHELVQNFKHVHYIPSYEMMIDELRDYRYYDRDMC